MRYGFKKAWKDGTHAVVLEPLDFIARLAAIVPPPRWHLIRYQGVLAANASERAEVVLGVVPFRSEGFFPVWMSYTPSSMRSDVRRERSAKHLREGKRRYHEWLVR